VPTTRDAIDVTAYARRVDADYAPACEAGIACVRETIAHFARFARAAACAIADADEATAPVYTPVSEISFVASAVRDVRTRIDPLLAGANRRHSR
jgi:hypothetical protein